MTMLRQAIPKNSFCETNLFVFMKGGDRLSIEVFAIKSVEAWCADIERRMVKIFKTKEKPFGNWDLARSRSRNFRRDDLILAATEPALAGRRAQRARD
jgi:hypothetical protein